MPGAETISEEADPTGDGSTRPPTDKGAASGVRTGPRHTWTFVAVAAVIVIVVAGAAAYAIYHGSHSSGGAGGTQLGRSGENYTISPWQYNAITFVTTSNGTVNGTIYEAAGLVVYLMTPAELEYLAIKGNISGYAWTSGGLGNYSEYRLSIPVAPGAWDVVFRNPNAPVTDLNTYLVYITSIQLVS